LCNLVADWIDDVGEERTLKLVEAWFLKHYPENRAKIGAATLVVVAKRAKQQTPVDRN
jgi:hypothetical protein